MTDESWTSWSGRLATDLTALTDDDWMTFTVQPDPTSDPAVTPTDVFLQARLLEGVLALECIGDTEFEGLTDLSEAQQSQLLALGWEPDDDDPELSRAFGTDEAAAGADLLAATLRDVLGATSPHLVDVRRRGAATA